MMTLTSETLPRAVAKARRLIDACERDLGYALSRGECNDLLLDNTRWTRSDVVAVMDTVGAPQ